ncbi:DUF6875 domain-containing protein [Streptomyces sp. A5-4]|uniref:DUF6875 domain-containing protein n=1 Tax=Streptomyces sp. A5-4 TaxID=3384771 RepID=UPI003DA9BC08
MHLTPPTTAQRAVISTWFDTYITVAHPSLGRAGAVCPYANAARHQGVVHIRAAAVRPVGAPQPRDLLLTSPATASAWLQSVLAAALDEFDHHPWPPCAQHLHSLIVLLEDLLPEYWGELDRVHADSKTAVMRRGLMAGQFHPHCPAPAVHNPRFAVNRAPVPLLVIRRMARHDHLFASEPQHLQAYERSFRPERRPETDRPGQLTIRR